MKPFALLKFMSKINQSTLNSHIVVKALFDFLDDCQWLCIVTFMVQCESVVVVVFLINILSRLNKLDFHVLWAHLSSVSKGLYFSLNAIHQNLLPLFQNQVFIVVSLVDL